MYRGLNNFGHSDFDRNNFYLLNLTIQMSPKCLNMDFWHFGTTLKFKFSRHRPLGTLILNAQNCLNHGTSVPSYLILAVGFVSLAESQSLGAPVLSEDPVLAIE